MIIAFIIGFPLAAGVGGRGCRHYIILLVSRILSSYLLVFSVDGRTAVALLKGTRADERGGRDQLLLIREGENRECS